MSFYESPSLTSPKLAIYQFTELNQLKFWTDKTREYPNSYGPTDDGEVPEEYGVKGSCSVDTNNKLYTDPRYVDSSSDGP